MSSHSAYSVHLFNVDSVVVVVIFFSQLVNIGVLTTRDIGSWWLSVPGAGIFMKNFSNGTSTIF